MNYSEMLFNRDERLIEEIERLKTQVELEEDNRKHLNKLLHEKDEKIERLTFIINHAKMYVERHEQLYDFDLMASPKVLLAILDGGLEEE